MRTAVLGVTRYSGHRKRHQIPTLSNRPKARTQFPVEKEKASFRPFFWGGEGGRECAILGFDTTSFETVSTNRNRHFWKLLPLPPPGPY